MNTSDPNLRLGNLLSAATQELSASSATPALTDEEFIALWRHTDLPQELIQFWKKQLLLDRRLRDQWTRLMRTQGIAGPVWLCFADDQAEHDAAADEASSSQIQEPQSSPQLRQDREPRKVARKLPVGLKRRSSALGWALATAALVLTGVYLWIAQPVDTNAQLAKAHKFLEQEQFAPALESVRPLLASLPPGKQAGEARQIAEQASFELLKRTRSNRQPDDAAKLLANAQAYHFDSGRVYVEALQARAGQPSPASFSTPVLVDDFGTREAPNPQLQRDWEQAITKYPKDRDLRLNFVYWLLTQWQYGKAQQYLESQTEDAQVALAAGVVRYLRIENAGGDHSVEYAAALESFLSVLKREPQNAVALYNAAVLYRKLNDFESARQKLDQARRATKDAEFLKRIQAETQRLPK
jgi:tetratricopeptide (TPR) repeat protein